MRLYAVQGVENATLSGLLEPLAVGSGRTSSLADCLVLRSAPRAPEAIKRSGGGLVLVSDKEIAEATKDLWSMELIAEWLGSALRLQLLHACPDAAFEVSPAH